MFLISTLPCNDTSYTVQSDTSLANTFCNNKTIIDNIFFYFNNIPTLLHYFFCVSQVFTKYRLSFKLAKQDLFLLRTEYVGHDLIASGN